MQDTERASRIEGAILRGARAAIDAEVFGFGPMASAIESLPRAALELARPLSDLMEAKVHGTSVTVAGGVPLVRVRLAYRGPKGRRFLTVTSGVSAFAQIIEPRVRASIFSPALPQVMAELSLVLRDESSRLADAVLRTTSELLADPKTVQGVKDALSRKRAREKAVGRENLVSQMCGLLGSGWSVEDLMFSVHEAVLRSVMQS